MQINVCTYKGGYFTPTTCFHKHVDEVILKQRGFPGIFSQNTCKPDDLRLKTESIKGEKEANGKKSLKQIASLCFSRSHTCTTTARLRTTAEHSG